MAKRAIVTGGGGLIGQGICCYLAKNGWEVANFDRQQGGSAATWIDCDVSNEKSVIAAFKTLGWEKVDVLVNNAGATDYSKNPLTEQSLEDWSRVIDTNLTGAFLMSREAAKRMPDKGSIINMTSSRAMMSEPGDFSYGASKGGLIAFTHTLAVSLGPAIRANAIAPGWISEEEDLRDIDHQQHPAGRVGRVEDICRAVGYLIEAEFVTGETLVVDGGMTKKMIYAE